MKTAADPEMASIAVGRLSAVGSRAQWLQRVSVIGRLGWGVADQAISSLTNVAVSLLLVRVLAPVSSERTDSRTSPTGSRSALHAGSRRNR